MTEQIRKKDTEFLEDLKEGVRDEHQLYHELGVAEDKQRTNQHYDLPSQFFMGLTGTEWNSYSCNVWENENDTRATAEIRKFDLMASLMKLKPGMRVLDVGCGWGGSICYLAQKYGIRGAGLMLAQTQKESAEARKAQVGVDVDFHICHWQEFEDPAGFDVIYSDEVIVHFNDLLGYFQKVYSLLKPGGLMVNKEVHYSRKQYLVNLTRGEAFINKIFGLTGNYRTLWEELTLVDQAGFELAWHHQIATDNYGKTMSGWLSSMHEHRESMIACTSEEIYKNFRIYCKLARFGFNTAVPNVDIVVARKAP